MLCDDLEKEDGGSRMEAHKGRSICIHITSSYGVVVQQKVTQHCEAIIFQLQKYFK